MTANTLDEERAEIWSSILDEMGEAAADESRTEACRYLMRHLIDTAGRWPGGFGGCRRRRREFLD